MLNYCALFQPGDNSVLLQAFLDSYEVVSQRDYFNLR